MADDRGVVVQIGALLIFTMLFISLALNQATLVPQENSNIEFDHTRQVKSDMAAISAAILTTGSDGVKQSASIKLGTRYPNRMLAVNPAPPAGRMQTTEPERITSNAFNVTNLCGYAPTSRTLEYTPHYHYRADPPTFVYENTVTYRNYSENLIIDSGQSMISGTTIKLTPIGTNFSASGTERTQLTFQGGPSNANTITPDGELRLTIPTQLSASTWETNDELLGDAKQVKRVEQNTDPDKVDIYLQEDTYTMACRAVGVDETPPSGSASIGTGFGSGGDAQYSGGTSTAITTTGGKLIGITNASQVALTAGDFAPTDPSSHQIKSKKRFLLMGFTFRNGSVGTTGYAAYHLVLGSDNPWTYEVSSSGTSWGSRPVYLYKEVDGKSPTKLIDGATIKSSVLDDWLKDRRDVNLLNESVYADPSKVDSELSEFETWLDNDEDVTMIVVDTHGRVNLDIK